MTPTKLLLQTTDAYLTGIQEKKVCKMNSVVVTSLMSSILISASGGREAEDVVRVRVSGVMRPPPPRLTTSPVLFTRIRSIFTALTLAQTTVVIEHREASGNGYFGQSCAFCYGKYMETLKTPVRIQDFSGK